VSLPRVSILLPVFDAETTLPTCLASIARQSESRFECVVVDDGSRDGSREVAERFATRDSRFRVLSSTHAGVAEASNRGLTHCRAPFVARMDADDWMHRERLALQLAAFATDPKLDALGTRVRYFPRSRVGEGLRAYEAWLNGQNEPRRVRADAFVECPVANPTLMLPRERFRALGYRSGSWPEDYDLVLRLLAAGGRIGVVPRRLHAWRVHDARLTHTSAVYAVERFTECKAHFLADGFLKPHANYLLWGYGRTGRKLSQALRSHGKRPAKIVELHPGRLGQTIHGAPVVSPAALGPPRGTPLIVSVAGADARGLIRTELARLGWRECVDFVCAA
jgi:glycosyltransferase involved in cell wall biosynthesis